MTEAQTARTCIVAGGNSLPVIEDYEAVCGLMRRPLLKIRQGEEDEEVVDLHGARFFEVNCVFGEANVAPVMLNPAAVVYFYDLTKAAAPYPPESPESENGAS